MTSKIREIRFDGNVTFVQLTKGYVAMIDAADAAEIGRWNWWADIRPRAVYAIRKVRIGAKTTTIRMHRAVLSPPPGLQVDHANSDGLDNRRCNLRLATRAQNNQNQRLKVTNTSGVKGVAFNNRIQKWQAYITVGNRRHHIGYFDTIATATAAVAVARAEMHGEFARAA